MCERKLIFRAKIMVATAEKKVKEEVFMQGNGSEDCAKKQQGLANQP